VINEIDKWQQKIKEVVGILYEVKLAGFPLNKSHAFKSLSHFT